MAVSILQTINPYADTELPIGAPMATAVYVTPEEGQTLAEFAQMLGFDPAAAEMIPRYQAVAEVNSSDGMQARDGGAHVIWQPGKSYEVSSLFEQALSGAAEADAPEIQPSAEVWQPEMWLLPDFAEIEPSIEPFVEAPLPGEEGFIDPLLPETEPADDAPAPDMQVPEPEQDPPLQERQPEQSRVTEADLDIEIDAAESLALPLEVTLDGKIFVPEDTAEEHRYDFSENTPAAERCTSEFMARTVHAFALNWYEQFGYDSRVKFGDFDAAEGHATHRFGINVDLTLFDRSAMNVDGDSEQTLLAAQMLVLSAEAMGDGDAWYSILHNDEAAIEQFNEWAEERGISTRMMWYDGHGRHLHMTLQERYEGVETPFCAPTTGETRVAFEAVTVDEAPPEIEPSVEDSETQSELDAHEIMLAVYETYPSLVNLSDATKQAIIEQPDWEFAVENYNVKTENFGPEAPLRDFLLVADATNFTGHDLEMAGIMVHHESKLAYFVVGDIQLAHGEDRSCGWLQVYETETTSWGRSEQRDCEINLNPLANLENSRQILREIGWEGGWHTSYNKYYDNQNSEENTAIRNAVQTEIANLQAEGLFVNQD